jgi:hypothetical protein
MAFVSYFWILSRLGAVRLTALSGERVIYIMTHDSIGTSRMLFFPVHSAVPLKLFTRI